MKTLYRTIQGPLFEVNSVGDQYECTRTDGKSVVVSSKQITGFLDQYELNSRMRAKFTEEDNKEIAAVIAQTLIEQE